jgi:hypothetical protein
MREHVSTVFMNTEHFAETHQRLIGGDEGNIRSIVGIPGDDMVATDDVRGRGYTHSRTFDIAEGTALSEKDAIKIGSIRYEVVKVGDPVLGMKTAHLGRTMQEVKGGKVFRNGDI